MTEELDFILVQPSKVIACDKSNVASAKTAMSCGGILTKEFEEDGVWKQHYTIDLTGL